MEEPCNLKWQELLKKFKVINRNDKDAKERYAELKELVDLDVVMTARQKSGLTDRCNYQIYLIDHPEVEPFSNLEKAEKRLHLEPAQANGKPKQ